MIDGRSQIATVADVTPDLARALALPLDKGAVISHRTLEGEFDGGAIAIGSRVRFDNLNLTILGVALEQLNGLYSDQNIDRWILSKRENPEAEGDWRNIWVLGRLRQCISLAHTQTVLCSCSAGLLRIERSALHRDPTEYGPRVIMVR
jgi:hypothetical protein